MLRKNPLHILYWLLITLLIFLTIYLLVKLYSFYGVVISFLGKIFLPFLISCLIAYLLYPITLKIHAQRIHKGLAVIIIYVVFFGGIAFLVYNLYPITIYQLRELNEQLPQLVEMYESIIYQLYESTSFLPEAVHDKIDQLIYTIEYSVENMINKLIGGVTKLFDVIVVITVIPVLVFYFLKDYEKIKRYIKRFIPNQHRQHIGKLAHAIDESLGNYIRGQLIVCFFVGVTTWIVFELIGVNYSLVLAIIMGFTNIIPYFGPIIGLIPAVAIAVTKSTKLVVLVFISVLGIQIIESNFLSPIIVGKSINIHPVAIIFALLVGGQIGGVVGMVVAVPMLTIIKVVVQHLLVLRTIN